MFKAIIIVPALVFKNDNRFEQAAYINDLLNSPKVRADLEKSDDGEEY